MKASDRSIILGLLVAGLAAAFWFLVIAPKREEASALDDEIATLDASVAEQEQLVAYAEAAEADYKSDYHRLVVLGKAVPGDSDSASLMNQMQTLADRAGLDFRTIVLADGSGATPTPAPTAETTADPAPAAAEDVPGTPVTSVAPTEAAAATLPIGATVGPAGLPAMPYDMSFRGDFFQFADFLSDLDSMVRTGSKGVGVNGRLLTVDGFVFGGDQKRGYPYLDTKLRVTSYVAPADQGLTGGATPEAPAATPAAAPAPAPAPAPTATGTVTP
jgi:Tfp pilus assembly protein PilO